MNNSGITANAAINAAAVWFILKAIEVIAFVVYDTIAPLVRWIRVKNNSDRSIPDPDLPDRKRVCMEYVFSGAGFLDIESFKELCTKPRGQKKIRLVFFSTLVPLALFGFELMSIILGNETSSCVTSTDINDVSSPALVLFGEGRRHGNRSATFQEIAKRGPQAAFDPCISWTSIHAGVEYLSSVCAGLDATTAFVSLSQRNGGLLSSSPAVGALILQEHIPNLFFQVAVFAAQDNVVSEQEKKLFGATLFSSQVVINGKNVLYQNATYTNFISDETKKEIRRDFRLLEREVGKGELFANYFEVADGFGFIWDDADAFLRGITMLAYAILAQATRDLVKPGIEMSPFNADSLVPRRFDISCEEDFRLPRSTSIIIIIVAVVARLVLLFIPSRSKPSVEVAMDECEDRAKSSSTETHA